MRTASFSTYVSGMTCRPCEDTILETLLAMRGILNADVSYWKASVQVTFDPEIVSEESIREKMVKIGYPPSDTAPGGKKTELLTGAAVLLLFFLMPHLTLPDIPQVKVGANLAFLFLVGLVTGTHCICMCGGIMLSQTSGADLRTENRASLNPFALYQCGRLSVSVLLGILFGAVGMVFTYNLKLKSMIYTLCGAAVVFVGLCMWGIFPGLRRIQAQISAVCRIPSNLRQAAKGKPFLVGALNALMPCAASSTMWIYAASTGSALHGGFAMLVWCLGTIPILGVFSLVGRLFSPKSMVWFQRFCMVLMLSMGLRMTWNGICLAW